ncbi:EamA family transporter [Vulgatibacter incomptus]|uniref:Putative DMT superfamily metabolite efflux protein n=1 Tax=Vulgatibacter incomptus TaxID=1391653 RepID=A0A0K1PCG7_9BACT|nr:DMT family transporter [Vulgatibacter incomptus]AKU90814.1 Putative DMT superfamily metabolite efflux protein precursor [Vulgatibacter incomptus]
MSRKPLPIPPIPLLLISAASVQGGAALAKELFPALGPAGASGLRLLFASVVLLAVFRPALWRLGRAGWKAVIPYGLALGGMNLTFYEALNRIPLGLAVTLEFVGPLGVALFGSRRATDFLWAALAGVGIVLIAPWQATEGSLDPVGVALALVAGGCWAVYIVAGGRLSRLLSEGESVTAGMLVATAVVLPFALAGGTVARMTPGIAGLGLVVAILSSALPYSLEMFALKALPSRTFGILMSLEPLIATLVGLVFLGEQLEPQHWIAMACISGASAGAALAARPKAEPAGA